MGKFMKIYKQVNQDITDNQLTGCLSLPIRFGRAEVLTGFANGLFLLFIALFIMKEAIERALEPPEVHHERLFVISVMGFIVNLVGIFVFQHGGQCNHGHSHTHDHHHHDHEHDHSIHNHSNVHSHSHPSHAHQFSHFSSPNIDNHQQVSGTVALDMNNYNNNDSKPLTHSHPFEINHNQNHEHNHNHHHDHQHLDQEPLISISKPRNDRGQIMESVFLHILADTLGSIGVMISAILMSQFGWLIADAICSLFIAILISISVFPLLRNSVFILMQRVPVNLEDRLPDCFDKIRKLPGVLGIHDPHFWTLYGNVYVGSLKLEIAHGASHRNVLENTKIYLNQIGVERHHIQIDQI